MLKGASSKGLEPKCDKAFYSIKEYVAYPLSLSQPVDGEEFYLYLATSIMAVCVALVRSNREDKQKPVYFVTKMLTDTETRYTNFERIALALRMAVMKLRPYFQVHTIVILTSYPIRVVLHKPDASGGS